MRTESHLVMVVFSPRPQVADNKASRRGLLYSLDLGTEEGSLNWTSEPATGLMWIARTTFDNYCINIFVNVFGNNFVNIFVNVFGNVFINDIGQHRLTPFVQETPSPGQYQVPHNL